MLYFRRSPTEFREHWFAEGKRERQVDYVGQPDALVDCGDCRPCAFWRPQDS